MALTSFRPNKYRDWARSNAKAWYGLNLAGFASVACWWLTLTFSSPSHASTLRRLSIEELVSYSDSIIVGRCEKTEAVWLGKRIYTIATVRVRQAAKGPHAPGNVIQVHILGGSVTQPLPVKMLVPGAETMTAGEEMLLFLEKFGDKRQFYRVVGMAQGKLSVSTDRKTGQKSVGFRLPIKGVKWVDHDGKVVEPGAEGAHEEAAEAGSLDGFLGRIHKIKVEQETRNGGAK